MQSTLYLLPAHAKKQPDTLIIQHAFYGAGDPLVPTAITAPTIAAAGTYYNVDTSTAVADVPITLPAAPLNDDKVVFRIDALGPMDTLIMAGTNLLSTGGVSLTLAAKHVGAIYTFKYNSATTTWKVSQA